MSFRALKSVPVLCTDRKIERPNLSKEERNSRKSIDLNLHATRDLRVMGWADRVI